MARIIIFGGFAKSLVRFRGDLIKEMIRQGHEVIGIAPEEGYAPELKAIGAKYHTIELQRTGINPFKDIRTALLLVEKFKGLRPDVLLSYTIKPVIYGSLAARAARIPQVYSMITGLGYAMAQSTFKQKLLSVIVRLLYKQALKNNDRVFFQNPDDMKVFVTGRLLSDPKQAVLINGSGVDTGFYSSAEASSEPITFLLVARMIREKGVEEFVEAARQLKPHYPHVRYQLLGPYDSNPGAIKPQEVESWKAEKSVEYLGETDDVRPYLSDSSVFVLPSYYPEGTPRSILEAMAVGRPVITTDTPGCRETVTPGYNGFLVPVKNSLALAEAMERFIINPSLVREMGVRSREMAVEKYDVHKVNRVILRAMELIGREDCLETNQIETGDGSFTGQHSAAYSVSADCPGGCIGAAGVGVAGAVSAEAAWPVR